MSDPNSFVSQSTIENLKQTSLAQKIAAIGGCVMIGSAVITFVRILSRTGFSGFQIGAIPVGGFLLVLYVLAFFAAICYLYWIVWQKSAAFGAYVDSRNDEDLTKALLLQKQFYQVLAMVILGSYAFMAFIALILFPSMR